MNNSKEYLGTERLGKLLFKLSLPTVTAQIVNLLYNMVDRIFIGHIENGGELMLTGVGVCMPLIMIISAFAALVSSGGAPRASIFLGKRDKESAERTLGGCFSLQIAVSVILTVAMLVFNRPLLLLFGASENTIGYATEYMQIYSVGTLFVQLTLGMNAFVSAQGFTRVSMISVVVGAVSNIILDPILIFGLGMGVRGAALATVISQGASAVFTLSFLLGKKTLLKLKSRYMIPYPSVVLPCIALGSATFIMQASESVISVCFNSSLLAYGGDVAVGAMTVMSSIMQFALLPMQGIAQGAQPILSYNFGRGEKERVKKTFYLLLSICLGYSLLIFGAVELFPKAFVSIFTDKAELVDFASRMLPIYFFGVGIFGIQIACQMTFVSLGKALSSVTVAVMRKFVLLLPLIYAVPGFVSDKAFGVYLAEPIADVCAVLFTSVLFFFTFRKALRSMDKKRCIRQ